ncbi:MAG: phenylalanine--tRNA ligase subunit alpha [Calditrichaeota bacterium]|nr:phenylalanine--tRNA ligase subunit alpha [Calditrichota bacterium]RQV92832.1 MAG: phenylalanine--tRNA ligase subunit alpha [bacterium]RQW01047.1 MAG: phenylalanine--tRNA ligase subunit alpha [Calditrichota bacterium]
MENSIDSIKNNFLDELNSVRNAQDLESLRIKHLGRKGTIQELYSKLKDADPADRPGLGKEINALRTIIEAELNEAKSRYAVRKSRQKVDLTLPGRTPSVGRKHPLTLVQEEIKKYFSRLGFSVADGPDVETDFFNFAALNFPENHPARAMQDTLFITENILLRTHTSPVQIRTMMEQKPPVRIIAPGRVYRRDTPDASHSPFFHQIEGLFVDKRVSFGHLRAVIQEFARYMFGADIHVRFRPSFFPFTEPSMEYDFNCIFCRGKGCKVCKYTGWIEISGAGMVHPNVFRAVGYDPDVITGYAFGMGVDRIAMLKYNIDDIRLFFENDMRFLSQFN